MCLRVYNVPMEPVATFETFKAYGPLGVVCALQFGAILGLFKLRESLRDRYDAQLKDERERYETMMQRHMVKAENWIDKGHTQQEDVARMLQLLDSRIKPRSTR